MGLMKAGNRADGFTLVELMVVVVVIAILIAIAVPRFTGAQLRAQDARAKTAVAEATRTIASSRTQSGTVADAPAMANEDTALTYTAGASTGPTVASVESVGGYSWVSVRSASGTCFTSSVTPNAVSDVTASTTDASCRALDAGGPVASLNGLVLWLDASATATIAESGGAVTQWQDRSPNANHVSQATAGMRPTLVTGAQNSRSIVRFDGTQELTAPDSPSLSVNGQEITIFAAFKSTTSGQVENDIINKEQSWELALVGDTFSSAAATATPRNWGWIGSLHATPSTWHTGSWRRDSTTFTWTLDGASASAATTPTGTIWPTSDPLTIGGRALYTTYRWIGDLAEIIVVNRAVTDTERDTITNYLKAKWSTT